MTTLKYERRIEMIYTPSDIDSTDITSDLKREIAQNKTSIDDLEMENNNIKYIIERFDQEIEMLKKSNKTISTILLLLSIASFLTNITMIIK